MVLHSIRIAEVGVRFPSGPHSTYSKIPTLRIGYFCCFVHKSYLNPYLSYPAILPTLSQTDRFHILKDMNYPSYKNIPNRLKQCRKHRGLSQKELADLMGFKDTTWISRWENGDVLPNLVSAVRLSVLLDIPMNNLFDGLVKRVQEEFPGEDTLKKLSTAAIDSTFLPE